MKVEKPFPSKSTECISAKVFFFFLNEANTKKKKNPQISRTSLYTKTGSSAQVCAEGDSSA